MSDKSISQEILEKIQNKEIQPKPKWHFLLKDYVVWTFGFISLFIGSLSFSAILYMLVNNDWDVYDRISGSWLGFMLTTLPYFWLIFLLIFILAAYYNFRHTKGGYRFEIRNLVIGSIIFSMLFGAFLFKIGVGQAIDNMLANNQNFYKHFINRRAHVWTQTENGLLAGVLLEAQDEHTMIIRDMEGFLWQVDVSELKSPPITLVIGQPIRILGEDLGGGIFEAEAILPMRGMQFLQDRLGPHGMMMEKMPPLPFNFERNNFQMRNT